MSMADAQWWKNFSKSFANGVNPVSGIAETEEDAMQHLPPPQIKPVGTEHAMNLARDAGDTVTAASLSGVHAPSPKPKRTGGYGGKVFQE